jgi:ABC-2 type transport system ATP-binding protein
MQHSDAPAIEVVGLTKTYGRGDKAVRALDGISFTVIPGQVFGVLGPNGAGKSTTVRILSTISRPDAGSARVAGYDVRTRPAAVRTGIGYVAQRPGFDPVGTGRENLVLSARLRGIGRKEAGQRAGELLHRFGLDSAADRLVRTWSGGMQRKLDVAMGLVGGPKVLFLDEPTTGLDPEARIELWTEVTRLTRSTGLTVLLTTHYMDEADQMADQLVIVERGRIVAEGTPAGLKAGLGGDTVRVELKTGDDTGRAAELVSKLAGVNRVRPEGIRLYAQAADAADLLPRALSELKRAGIGFTGASVAQASLDDVYLRYAGRAYSQTAGQEAA